MDDSGHLRKWVGNRQGASISENRDLTNGWFVFVESESRVWTYYGEEHLQLTEYSKSAPPLGSAPFIFSEIPPSVVSKLPVGLKEKLEVEQASAGQSATRSESDSEGGDKPQPVSEERSR